MVNELLANLEELDRINQQILFLAEHLKEHTIDKIMAMDDVDLALSFLTDKLYAPTEPEKEKASTAPKNKSFKLPPDVVCQKEAINDGGGTSYTFRHNQWGEIGRIDVIAQGKQSQINAYVVASDPYDPLAELRAALFRTIAMEFNAELEKANYEENSINSIIGLKQFCIRRIGS